MLCLSGSGFSRRPKHGRILHAQAIEALPCAWPAFSLKDQRVNTLDSGPQPFTSATVVQKEPQTTGTRTAVAAFVNKTLFIITGSGPDLAPGCSLPTPALG